MTKYNNEHISDNLSIVIPVYNALKETIECLTSLFESDAGNCQILVMDDGSNWENQEKIKSTFSSYKNLKYISHFRNRGYTRNVKMGVKLTKTDYVCILNSDTLLPKIWARPMMDIIKNNAYIAGIGPLSNAASYQSIPETTNPLTKEFSENNQLGFDCYEREQVSHLVENLGQKIYVDVPVLNGFCTIFRRNAIDIIGSFDVQNYPEGYGEENDLCIRLRAEGYRLVVSLGVFVHHQKSKSFGFAMKKILSAKGKKSLVSKFGHIYVSNITKQLESSVPLKSMRDLIKISAKNILENSMNVVEMDGKKIDIDKSFGHCIALKGGKTYFIEKDSVTLLEDTDSQDIVLSAYDTGISVSLPKYIDIKIFSTEPIATMILALSLRSIEQIIYVNKWDPEKEKYFINKKWPIEWGINTSIESFFFKKISFDLDHQVNNDK